MSNNLTLDIEVDTTCNPNDVRRALRHIASTVHVIATRVPDGAFFATTATAVVSACLEPPTLAFCINRSATIAKFLNVGSKLSVSALNRNQAEVARACAGGLPHEERERFFSASNTAGCLYVNDADVSFIGECSRILDVGTHALCFLNVQEVIKNTAVRPLLYLDTQYGVFEAHP